MQFCKVTKNERGLSLVIPLVMYTRWTDLCGTGVGA
jgi:hypothetical protein